MILVGATLLLTGCGKLPGLGATPVEAKTGHDTIEAFLTYQDALIGKGPGDVEEVFGKPKGVFEKSNGTTWMYPRWRVEFDANGVVRGMERDIASTRTGARAAVRSMALATAPQASGPASSVVKISNGGQNVDLRTAMPPGKVVIVDFYADWCGPCRSIAPHLEQLANGDPDVALVKVDIVKWGTPVTQQYNINSVPNVRVFDKAGRQIGKPTSSLSRIQAYVKQAGG
jgi:thioredoxin 1